MDSQAQGAASLYCTSCTALSLALLCECPVPEINQMYSVELARGVPQPLLQEWPQKGLLVPKAMIGCVQRQPMCVCRCIHQIGSNHSQVDY